MSADRFPLTTMVFESTYTWNVWLCLCKKVVDVQEWLYCPSCYWFPLPNSSKVKGFNAFTVLLPPAFNLAALPETPRFFFENRNKSFAITPQRWAGAHPAEDSFWATAGRWFPAQVQVAAERQPPLVPVGTPGRTLLLTFQVASWTKHATSFVWSAVQPQNKYLTWGKKHIRG